MKSNSFSFSPADTHRHTGHGHNEIGIENTLLQLGTEHLVLLLLLLEEQLLQLAQLSSAQLGSQLWVKCALTKLVVDSEVVSDRQGDYLAYELERRLEAEKSQNSTHIHILFDAGAEATHILEAFRRMQI